MPKSSVDFRKNSLISCGGFDRTNDERSSACYGYNLTASSWKSIANMNTPRYEAASVVIDENQIWITGGGNYGGPLKSTEIFNVETNTFTNGPDLPESTWQHCMTKYNDTHIFIGGAGGGHDKSYLVDRRNFVFEELPNLSKDRYGAGCGVIQTELISTIVSFN